MVRPVAAVLVLLAGCAAMRPAPGDQAGLVERAGQVERELAARGLFYEDAALARYLDGVAARLAPADVAARVHLRVRVLRTTDTNAFALPDGGVYVAVGLLACIEDEAQLAHVLAHEVSHLVHGHALAGERRRAAEGDGLAAAPSGFAGSEPAADGDPEAEADRDALRALRAAGYPTVTVPRLLDRLDPERADAIRALLAAEPESAGDPRAAGYRIATAGVVREKIRLSLDTNDFRHGLEEAEAALARDPAAAILHLYAGDAHRALATDPGSALAELMHAPAGSPAAELRRRLEARTARELEAAAASYRRALELDPGLAAAHRGLGLVAAARGDGATARLELEAYLASEDAPRDRAGIVSILATLPR